MRKFNALFIRDKVAGGTMKMSQELKTEEIIRLMQRDDSVDAPKDVVKWAKNLFLARERRPSLVRRIVAVLRADLLPNRVLAGERSATAAQSRQMFFTAGDYGVDLRITAGRKSIGVKGQILGTGFENASIRLMGSEGSFETKTDAAAMFELNVPSGEYELEIRHELAEIVIEGIEL